MTLKRMSPIARPCGHRQSLFYWINVHRGVNHTAISASLGQYTHLALVPHRSSVIIGPCS
ncbi:MAG: hypothetical protein OJF52_001003 [Nitrospira sp.]|nr:MAG: hypothetical protein OJF52_001003 [Nitrospira sp.]